MRFEFDFEALRPVIQQVVSETITRLMEEQSVNNSRIAYTEPEAAALLGVQAHVLRDLRRMGEIEASKLGKRIVYTRANLIDFLERNRWRA